MKLNVIKEMIPKFCLSREFYWTYATIVLIIGIIPMGCGAHVYHIVERGETLYSVGWLYGYDYKTVARWNQLKTPYVLKVGQRLRVAPVNGNSSLSLQAVERDTKYITERRLAAKGSSLKTDKQNKSRYLSKNQNTSEKLKWYWPTKKGTIVNRFVADDPGKKGLDILGKEGQLVLSASTGTVVYSGSGLLRYGKLIIVKHNETFLSAYAHNKELLVKEGDKVKIGQRIAVMGKTGMNNAKLHFQIRKYGKPIDPIQLLPKQVPGQFE